VAGGGLDVVAQLSFSALDISAFETPTFESTFRTEFITTVAGAAGVEPYRVTVNSITAGSVAVGFTVQFPLTATAAQTTFANTLSTATSSVFASSTVMQSYGIVTAVVRWLCDCVPCGDSTISFHSAPHLDTVMRSPFTSVWIIYFSAGIRATSAAVAIASAVVTLAAVDAAAQPAAAFVAASAAFAAAAFAAASELRAGAVSHRVSLTVSLSVSPTVSP
jgi:hypothetical protein